MVLLPASFFKCLLCQPAPLVMVALVPEGRMPPPPSHPLTKTNTFFRVGRVIGVLFGYQCYYPKTPRDSLSPVWGIFIKIFRLFTHFFEFCLYLYAWLGSCACHAFWGINISWSLIDSHVQRVLSSLCTTCLPYFVTILNVKWIHQEDISAPMP